MYPPSFTKKTVSETHSRGRVILRVTYTYVRRYVRTGTKGMYILDISILGDCLAKLANCGVFSQCAFQEGQERAGLVLRTLFECGSSPA